MIITQQCYIWCSSPSMHVEDNTQKIDIFKLEAKSKVLMDFLCFFVLQYCIVIYDHVYFADASSTTLPSSSFSDHSLPQAHAKWPSLSTCNYEKASYVD